MIAATNHNQIARTPPSSCLSIGRPAIPPVGRAAAINDPEQTPSLPAGGRSLMGGCASRRQTRAQGGVLTMHRNRAIRPTRHFNQRQRSSGTALGLRWGLYRTTCAVGTTGRRFAGLGCHRRGFEFPAPRGYDLLTRLGGGLGPRPFLVMGAK